MVLEFHLAASKLCLIGLKIVETAASLRRLLCRHAPVSVKFDWLVSHNRLPFPGLRQPDFALLAPDGFENKVTVVGDLWLLGAKNRTHIHRTWYWCA